MQGWICLNRKLLESDVWADKPFSKGQAWVDLLLLANHTDKSVMFNGSLLTINRGELITSQRKLSLRWGWDKRKVARFLEYLETHHMIAQKCTAKYTTVTLVNYGKYQNQCTTDVTTDAPLNAHKQQYINNDKQSNREKYIKEKHKYGEFQNVFLTDEELEKLKEKRPDNWEECIEILSEGLARKGYKYKSHYLAILKWTEKEVRKGESKNDREQRADIRKADEEFKFS